MLQVIELKRNPKKGIAFSCISRILDWSKTLEILETAGNALFAVHHIHVNVMGFDIIVELIKTVLCWTKCPNVDLLSFASLFLTIRGAGWAPGVVAAQAAGIRSTEFRGRGQGGGWAAWQCGGWGQKTRHTSLDTRVYDYKEGGHKTYLNVSNLMIPHYTVWVDTKVM